MNSNRLLTKLLTLFVFVLLSTSLFAQNTYYTYNAASTNDWADPLRWTTDPGGAGFPGDNVPAGGPGDHTAGSGLATDRVIIRQGATVNMTFDGLTIAEIEIQENATLNLVSSDGHDLGTINGTGRIRLEPLTPGGDYEFPAGTWDAFLADNGGEIDLSGGAGSIDIANLTANVNYFEDADVSINSSTTFTTLTNFYTFNRLTLSGTDDKTFPNNRFKFNGDVRIEDAASMFFNANLRLVFEADLVNASTAPIAFNAPALTSAASYDAISTNQIFIRGDLVNQGNGGSSMLFTPKTGLSNATVNSTTVIFDNHFTDQALTCNGEVRLECVVINKGSDQTYALNITADGPNQFNLFGRTNGGAPNDDDDDSEKALALNSGTVSLGSNTYARLSTGNNYNINVDARLLINGGTAEQTGGPATVPYGTLQISNGGTMIADVGSGVTIRESGVILVEDGLLEARQIRTSVLGGALHLGAYIQSGGLTRLVGGNPGANRARFSLPYTTNVFQMSGGVMEVHSQNLRDQGGIHERGIDIRSNQANYAVSGGTVQLVMDGSTTRRTAVNTTAPFFNFDIVGGGGRNVSITAINNPSGGDFAPIVNQPLVVINAFSIADNLNFFGEDNDITIGGNLTLGNNVIFDPGTQTTTFNRSVSSAINLQNPTYDYALEFDRLIVDKPGATLNCISAGRASGITNPQSLFLTVNNELRVENGLFDYTDFRIRMNPGTDLYLEGDLGQVASVGRVQMNQNPPATHTIEVGFGSQPTLGHLELAQGNDANLTGDDMGELGQLTMPSATGVLNIGALRLPIRNGINVSGGAFNYFKSIRVDGNFSDRGVGFYLDANGTYTYPISTNANATARYTPVTATISGFPGASEGYLDFSVVDQEHPSLNNAAPAGSALTYFFRARTSGFGGTLPQAIYDFEYANSDDAPTPVAPMVPGKIVSANREFEDAPDYDDPANTIQFDATGSFAIETGDYTAGNEQNFNGGVDVFYSRYNTGGSYGAKLADQPNAACCGVGQGWNEHTTWSFDSHNGPSCPAGVYPEAGDIVYIADGHRVYAGDATGGDPFNSFDTPVFASQVHLGGNLYFRGDDALQNSEIQEILDTTTTGARLWLEVDGNSPSAVPLADIGSFATDTTNDVRYRWVQTAASGTFDVPGTYRTYPRMSFWGAGGQNTARLWDGAGTNGVERRFNLPNQDLTANGNMNITTGCVVEMSTGANGDILVRSDLLISSHKGNDNCGMLEFAPTGTARTLDVRGDVEARYADRVDEPSGIRVLTGGTAINHTLRIGGDLSMTTDFTVLNFNETAKIDLIFDGDDNATFTRNNITAAANRADFYRVIIDKSGGQSDTVRFDGVFDLDNSVADAAAAADKNFVVTSGIAHLNDPDIDIDLSTGGGNFVIPQAGGLFIDNGATANITNVAGEESNLELIGSLRLGGTVGGPLADRSSLLMTSADVDVSTDIVYSPTASASIAIFGDAYLSVGGQIRRQAIPPVGGLSYTQGGTSIVEIGGEIDAGEPNSFVTTRGVFDHAGGAGSTFDMSGGELRILRPVPNSSVAEMYLQANTFSMTGGTIVIGENGMPAGQAININAAVGNELFNLSIADAGATANTGLLEVNPIVINGNLNILGANSTFRADNLDVSIRGNFLNEGTYTNTSNNTIFDGTANQTITLDNLTNFANFTVDNPGNTVSMAGTETNTIVNRDLFMLEGTLDLQDKTMELRRDATNDAIVTNTTGGVLFNNAASQVQTIFGNGNGQFGNLEVDNPSSVLQDEDIRVNGDLTLTTGRFIPSFHELILGPVAQVVNYDATRYLQTDGTNSSAGVTKIITGTGAFTLPVGNSTRYAPATYNVTGLGSAGRLTLKPINGPPSEYTDPLNLFGVDFHWVVRTDAALNITGLTHTYNYNDADLQTPSEETAPTDLGAGLDEWTAGYLFNGANSWVKIPAADVNTGTNIASFTNTSASNLEAIYAIGHETELDAIREYWSRGSGSYADVNNWSTVCWTCPDHMNASTTAPVPPDPDVTTTGGAASVHINTSHVVNVDQNNTEAFNVELLGVLDVDNYVGMRGRQFYGDGRVIMRPNGVNANLPVGDWSRFVQDGGTHEFAGTAGDYDLPTTPQIAEFWDVDITGTSTKVVTDNNIRVLNDLLIDGPELDFNDLRMRVGGDVTLTSGTIDAGIGELELDGTTDQTLTGDFTTAASANLYDLDLNKTGGDMIISTPGTVEVEGELIWSRNALVQTGASSTLRFLSSATWTGANNNAYINGSAEKVIFNGDEFVFPVGKSGQYRRARAFNIGGAAANPNLSCEFFPATLLGTLPTPPIEDIEQNAHWVFEAPTGVNSRFNLYWPAAVAPYNAPARVVKSANALAGTPVQDMGGVAQVGTTTTTGDIKSTAAHTFASPISTAIGYELNPLPVELLSFTGELTLANTANLFWTTANEQNSFMFEVERSVDAENFNSIGALAAAGESVQVLNYTFTDANLPSTEVVYYRLKQLDYDGSFTYSDVIELRPMGDGKTHSQAYWNIAPNPTTGAGFRVYSLNPDAESATVQLIGLDGRVLRSDTGNMNHISEGLSSTLRELPEAVYILRLQTDNAVQQFRIMKR